MKFRFSKALLFVIRFISLIKHEQPAAPQPPQTVLKLISPVEELINEILTSSIKQIVDWQVVG